MLYFYCFITILSFQIDSTKIYFVRWVTIKGSIFTIHNMCRTYCFSCCFCLYKTILLLSKVSVVLSLDCTFLVIIIAPYRLISIASLIYTFIIYMIVIVLASSSSITPAPCSCSYSPLFANICYCCPLFDSCCYLQMNE